MTARPGCIKVEIPVPLPRPRAYEVQVTPEFIALKRRVMALIREESLRSIAQEERLGGGPSIAARAWSDDEGTELREDVLRPPTAVGPSVDEHPTGTAG